MTDITLKIVGLTHTTHAPLTGTHLRSYEIKFGAHAVLLMASVLNSVALGLESATLP